MSHTPPVDSKGAEKLTKKEMAALAMHEIMVREQNKYRERAEQQRKVAFMTDKDLRALVDEIALKDIGTE